MEFADLIKRATEIRRKYAEFEKRNHGKEWGNEQLMEGFVGDVGDLMKIVQAKEGFRDMKDVDEKLAHELSDCLWSIIVIAERYNLDLEKVFMQNMDKLEDKISSK